MEKLPNQRGNLGKRIRNKEEIPQIVSRFRFEAQISKMKFSFRRGECKNPVKNLS
jgi:hypothetical protein